MKISARREQKQVFPQIKHLDGFAARGSYFAIAAPLPDEQCWIVFMQYRVFIAQKCGKGILTDGGDAGVEWGIWALNLGGLVQMGVFNLLCFVVLHDVYTFVMKL